MTALELELKHDFEQCTVSFANTYALICLRAKARGVPVLRISELLHAAIDDSAKYFDRQVRSVLTEPDETRNETTNQSTN